MLKIAIIIGTTRPNRKSEAVAKWAYGIASQRADAQFELLDLRDYDLPLFNEPKIPSRKQYTFDYTRAWSEKIASYDAYVFVTAEYNHSIPAVLKNAIDYLWYEWHDKAAGFVSYGSAGGARAVEHLRGVMGELHVADVRPQVLLFNTFDFENYTIFKPTEAHAKALTAMLDKLVEWGEALKAMREKQASRL